MLRIPADRSHQADEASRAEALRRRPVSESLLAVQSAWKAQSVASGRPTARPLLIHAFSPELIFQEERALDILARADRIDAQNFLREKRSTMGFDKYSESRFLEDFEFGFPDDEDDEDAQAGVTRFALGDEDDDELERHDQQAEDEEYELLDMQDDDDDMDVTDDGDDPEDQEWALMPDEQDLEQDVWAQVLGLAMSLHSHDPKAASKIDLQPCVAVQPAWVEPWHMPAWYKLKSAPSPEPEDGSPMPEPAELAAVLRYWGRHWGAEPVLAGPGVLACLVQRVPTDRNALRRLAEEHLALSPRPGLSSRLIRQVMQDVSRARLWIFRW